jgi:hypothetical protein
MTATAQELKTLTKTAKANMVQSKLSDYMGRIEEYIRTRANKGISWVTLRNVPMIRSKIAEDVDMFMALAKELHSLGFEVKYQTQEQKYTSSYTLYDEDIEAELENACESDLPHDSSSLIIKWA